jgi:hypothetical protein
MIRTASPRPARGSVHAAKHPRPCHHCAETAIVAVLALIGAPLKTWQTINLCPAHHTEYLADAGYRWPTEALAGARC